jgi:hypothetical protein
MPEEEFIHGLFQKIVQELGMIFVMNVHRVIQNSQKESIIARIVEIH